MKRSLLVLLVMALQILFFGNAYAAGPAPSFGITAGGVKLGDVKCGTWSSGMHQLIVDGPDVYAVRLGGLFSEQEVIMDHSSDNGLTWLNSSGIARGAEISICSSPVIAIHPVTKSLHYAWETYDSLLSPNRNIYYGDGVNATRINGAVVADNNHSKGIAVDGNGVIHIVFPEHSSEQLYYTASDNGVTFSEPSAIPGAIGDYISFAADNAGNLLLAYNRGHNFIKKSSGAMSWSSPVSTNTGTGTGFPSMAVYDDPSRIYIAVNATISASSDGGQTWTPYSSPGTGIGNESLAVDSNGILNYSWQGANGSDIYFARTLRSNDPSRWGTPVIALSPGAISNIAVDQIGKAYIMAEGIQGVAVFTKEK